MEDFVVWLNNELNNRGWTNSELSRRSGMANSTISMVISGQSKPGWDFCVGIARAFNMAAEKVFRLAQLLPPEPTPASGEQEVLSTYRRLSGPQRDTLLAMLRGLTGQPAPSPTPASSPDIDAISKMLGELDPSQLQMADAFVRWLTDQPSSTSIPTDEPKAITWAQVLEHLATMPENERDTWLTNQIRIYKVGKRAASEESNSPENDNPHQQPAPGEPI